MAIITELAFPVFKEDPESLAEQKKKSPEAFSHFAGVEGLLSFSAGSIIGKGPGSRVLAIEWSDVNLFHAFYPDSEKFKTAAKLTAPFVAAPPKPELYTAPVRSTACFQAAVTQVIKGPSSSGTDEAWESFQTTLRNSTTLKLQFYLGYGLEQNEGTFLGLIGWPSLQDYERLGNMEALSQALTGLGKSDALEVTAIQLTSFPI